MRKLHLIWVLIFAFPLSAVAQDDQKKPEVSKDPLTPEQLAVYRAVLADYIGTDGDASLNLARQTVPLDPSDSKNCVKSIRPRADKSVHTFDSATDLGVKVVLVDPEAQAATVKENDPGKLIQDTAGNVSQGQLEGAVKTAFKTALFTFSEIAFDKLHRYAIVSYSFYCGGLCGNGATVVLQRSGKTWKVKRACSNWISQVPASGSPLASSTNRELHQKEVRPENLSAP